MKLKSASSLNNRFEATSSPYPPPEAEHRLRVLEFSVGALIERTKTGDFWAEGFSEVTRLLKVVPLKIWDFSAAQHHLQNSIDYCGLGEYGAAAFELRVVRGILLRL